jgi:maltoporin
VAALLSSAARASAQPASPPADATPPADAKPAPGSEAAPPAAEAKPPVAAPLAAPPSELPRPLTGFSFGSYGRMIAATDFKGRPGRDADIVAHGSRLDEGNYVELELRRDDDWAVTRTSTRVVATLAVGTPLFHTTGQFDVKLAVRNLYLEARNVGGTNLSVWAGSRMYRGDDVYLLDWWPLDNLNTVGGGVHYDFGRDTYAALQFGTNQPANDFYVQQVFRPAPLDQIGAASVSVLNRQKLIGSLKLSHILRVGETGGVKGVVYGEVHQLPQGQRETKPEMFETLPGDLGGVVGAQIGAFTGKRDTHLNLFVRYARGLAAYGELSTPTQLAADKTTAGAHEILAAVGGNFEAGPFGLMLGGYVRSFRNASKGLDVDDVDEAIIALRPHVFFGELGGLAVEGSFQTQQRGVLAPPDATTTTPGTTPQPAGPLAASVFRFGVIPFLSVAGRGDYSRPQLRLIYVVSARNEGAKALYPQDDVFHIHSIEHFFGFGAEWWFNSSSYGG